jgi:DNA replication protein DnaC
VNAADLRSAGAPEVAIKTVLAGVLETASVAAVRAFIATEDSFLVLAGRPGTGKTVASVVGMAEIPPERVGTYDNPFGGTGVLERRRTFRFADSNELAQASNFDGDLWAQLRRVHLLVIDDAGRETLDSTGRALGNLVNLLCRRHDDAKRTILTTNLDATGWLRRYTAQDGGRLLDRMREQEHRHGRSPFYVVAGPSLRGASVPRNGRSGAPPQEANPS